MADVTGVQAATLPQPGADMATIRKRSLDIHNRAIGLLESAHARIQYAMEVREARSWSDVGFLSIARASIDEPFYI